MSPAAVVTTQTSDAPLDARKPHGFWALIVTQFLGAWNDNALKWLVTFFIVATLPKALHEARIARVGFLFTVPFLLFSLFGGWLADRFSKRAVTIGVKVFEILVMSLALFALAQGRLSLLLACVFLMGTHSAFFAPSKYGLLPELLPQKRLSWGNGVIEMGTMSAIILGAVAAGVMSDAFSMRPQISGAILLAVAISGLIASLGIGRVPAADPRRALRLNPLAEFASQWRDVRGDRVLVLSIWGNTYFWFLGLILQMNIVILGKETLHLSDSETGYLQAALAIGIGLGSVAAGRLSGNKIEYGLIPFGTLGLTTFAIALAAPGLPFAWVLADLALLGFFGGFFVVPINALIQHRPDEARKGGVIAFANLLSSMGLVAATGLYYLATAVAHLSPQDVFLIAGIITLGTTIYALTLLPDALLRFVLWLLTHTLYSVRVVGRDHVPAKGGALFVCNHLSFVDVALMVASTDRFIRFVMHRDFYELPWLRPFARWMRAIPVSATMGPREMIQTLRTASDAIRDGEVVCIFAEGQISRIGQLLPFARGLERIMRAVDAPIVPVCIDNVWGSVFSFSRGRFLFKLPERPLEPVAVCYGKHLPANTTAIEVRQAVQELMSDAWELRRASTPTLERAFIHTARRHPRRLAMADLLRGPVRFGSALIKAIYLARRLRPRLRGQTHVGLLLPPSVGGALVNHAVMLLGKVPVHLNYTTSAQVLASCAEQCRLQTIVTSRAFLDKVKIALPFEPLLLEDVAAAPRIGERLMAVLLAFATPAPLVPRLLGAARVPGSDDVATIIFSSGSTGDPKGVLLTHFNIVANVRQIGQTFALSRKDRIVGILPFFHSFGFTATLALPIVLGVGVAYHVTPLDAKAVGALVSQYAATFLLSTPTFLQTYARRCPPEAFGSLQFVMAGAEKLSERVATAFEERFGIRPLEGYGCTECAPAVCVNTRDFRAAGFRQVGGKRGKIGHPLPGISVRIVDLETGAPLPAGKAGLLWVRGPNVMRGYLDQPEKTAEVLQDGWYLTGDVAAMDADGFIEITDRLSRFSKIGGEMVPHVKVEDALHELAGATEQTFVVTGLPDEKKGERLTVLHTLEDEPLDAVRERLKQAGLPNLWVPRGQDFHRIDAIPLLGTGKIDLRRIRTLAQERAH